MRDPALVLGPALARPVDAAHAQHGGGQAETAGGLEHVLVRRALGAAIGRVEIERPAFADAVVADIRVDWHIGVGGPLQLHVGEIAIDLVRAREDEGHGLAAPAQRIQQAEGAAEVDVEILARVDQAGRHRDLGGEVEHGCGVLHRILDRRAVADVGLHARESRFPWRRMSQSRLASTPGRASASRTTTSWPSEASRSARLEPMKPAPPVTRTGPVRDTVSPGCRCCCCGAALMPPVPASRVPAGPRRRGRARSGGPPIRRVR